MTVKLCNMLMAGSATGSNWAPPPECVFSEQRASVFRITGLTLHWQTTGNYKHLINLECTTHRRLLSVYGAVCVLHSCSVPAACRASLRLGRREQGDTSHFNHWLNIIQQSVLKKNTGLINVELFQTVSALHLKWHNWLLHVHNRFHHMVMTMQWQSYAHPFK